MQLSMRRTLQPWAVLGVVAGVGIAACSGSDTTASVVRASGIEPSELRVLFIGSSHTTVNDLPGMLTRIAATAGVPPTITTDRVVQDGARLSDHWSNGVARTRIEEGGWTHVVLQGQGLEPAFSEAQYMESPGDDFFDFAPRFGDLAVRAGAKPTLFVTWARAGSDERAYYPEVGFINPAHLQDSLTSANASVGRRWPQSVLACAGEAFRQSLEQHPEIALLASDGNHATVAGTYLAACTFYVALTGRLVPSVSEVPSGVSAEEAAHLRDIARIGSNCADVRIGGAVRIQYARDQSYSGTTISERIFLSNTGDTEVGIADANTLEPPFAWSTGIYPGGSGVDVKSGLPYCSDSLPPRSLCAMSVSFAPMSFTGEPPASGRITLNLTGAYTPEVTGDMQVDPWVEARLRIRPLLTPAHYIFAHPGETVSFHVLVTNDSYMPATSLGPVPENSRQALREPFYWGPTGTDGSFPGGSGTVDIDGTAYEYCTTLGIDAGHTCVLTLNFSPPVPSEAGYSTRIRFVYSDAYGEGLMSAYNPDVYGWPIGE